MLAGALVFGAQRALAAEDDPAFTVSGVTVDETADNAAMARDQAMLKAKRQALSTLAERNLSGTDFKKLQLPEDAVIGTLIHDFEIQGEKVSSTRYVASMTFRFAPEAVRSYFGLVDIEMTQRAEHSVLILPVMSVDGKNLLWEEDNIWLAAWKRAPHRDLLTDIYVPAGDVLDAESANADVVLSGALDAIGKLTGRYGAKEAVIVIASGGTAEKPLTIEIYQFVAGELGHTGTLTVVVNDLEDTAALMDVAVGQVGDYLDKQQQALSGEHRLGKLSISVTAVFNSVAQWADIQRRLDQIEGLEKSVISLGQTDAGISLTWAGDEAALRAAVAEQGLMLGSAARQVDAENSGEAPFLYELRLIDQPAGAL